MKISSKVILALILVLSLSFSLIACDDNDSTEPCATHTDKDGNGVCDVCKSAVKAPTTCTHKDLNDDEKCDDCGEAFSDGCSNHVDANDDGICDVDGCGKAYTDKCDNHVDKDDNGVCDTDGCDEAIYDGCDNHIDKNGDGICDVYGCYEVCGSTSCGNHVDKNDDGVCDTDGCGAAFIDGCDKHVDRNNDGICDNAGCGEPCGNGQPGNQQGGTSFDDATVLTEGVAASHDVYTYAQAHYYKMTASTTGAYDVKFWGSYFYITVYPASATSPIASWTVYFSDDATVNTVNLTAGNDYYFVVTSQYEYGYPEIEVSISTGESGSTTEKPDDAGFDSATALVANGVTNTYSSDADQTTYFVFTATETLNYILAIHTDSLFPLLTIYDANKELVGTYYNVWGDINLTFPVIEGETFYLAVMMQVYEGMFDMTLTSSDVPVCLEHVFTNSCDTTCNNEGCSGTQVPNHVYDNDCDTTCNNEGCATPVRTVFGHVDASPADGKCDSCGATVSSGDFPTAPKFDTAVTLVPGKLTLDFSDSSTVYYYVYTAKETGEHNIKINAGLDYPCLKIYDANENLILAPEYGEFGTIDVDQAMTAGERYYIVVSVIFAPASLDFTFSTPKANTPEDSTTVSGGASFADAIAIVPGKNYTVSLDRTNNKIYFKFTATDTEAYHVYVSGNKNAMVQVWRDEENTHQSPVYANWGTGLIDKDLEVFTEGETYYIVVSVSGNARATLEFIFTDVN